MLVSDKSHFLTLILVVGRLRYQADSVERLCRSNHNLEWLSKENYTYLMSKIDRQRSQKGNTLVLQIKGKLCKMKKGHILQPPPIVHSTAQ